MAAPVYATDLTLIDAAENSANYSALGGGAAGLNNETDYFIENTQCVSKNGFTASTRGIMMTTGTRTVAAGDAIFVWGKQNNRNLMDTIAAGGMEMVIGNSTSAYDHFRVDGSDSPGSALAGWRNYAVDPTQTPSTTTGGGAAGTNYVGFLWKILGSGSLKGAPNAIDVQRHGRELQCTNGDVGNGYATFDGAALFGSNTARRWGILYPVAGGYQFHGCFVMGTVATAVDFRDSDRVINVLDDPFLPAGFNEFEIRNASSNVEWTNIIINHLGTNSPAVLTLNVGTFTGSLCQFTGFSTTTFASTGACTFSTWTNCDRINLNEADISGSSILNSNVVADEGAIFDNRTTTGATNISELDDCTIEQGTNAHHAIRFGANVDDDLTLTGIAFNGFSSVADSNGATLRFDATTGSINVNLVDCEVDGNPATTSNVGVDDAAGITVTLVVDPKTTKLTITDNQGTVLENARCFLETADNGGGSGFAYQAAVTTLTQASGTATLTSTSPHGLATNDYVVIRGANNEGYNRQAQITVTGASTFTYTVPTAEPSPAGGTPVFSYAPISGLTNASGIIQSSKAWPASQGLTGWARKSSANVKQSEINITDASGGTDLQVALQPDT